MPASAKPMKAPRPARTASTGDVRATTGPNEPKSKIVVPFVLNLALTEQKTATINPLD